MPTTWSLVPLADLGRWYGGGTPSKAIPAYWEDGLIPWVSPKDMKVQHIRESEDYITEAAVSSSATNLIPKDSILLVTRSGILKHSLPVAVNKVDCTINQDIKALVPFCGINPEYVAYALRAYEADILARTAKSGTTVQSIEFPELLSYKIPLTSTNEQVRIVEEIESHLTRLDAANESLKRVQSNLKRYRAAALKAACEGRLVPMEAELARAAGCTATTHAKTWPTHQIKDFCEIDIGFAFKSAEFSREGVRLLRGENIEPERLRWEDVRYWPEEKLEGWEYLLINEGDIILAMDRPLISAGLKIARATKRDLPCLLVQRMARIRPADPEMTEFLYYALQTDSFIRHLSEGQTGTQLPHISGKQIGSFALSLPPIEEQRRITAEISRRLSLVEGVRSAVQANLRRAQSLRRSILAQAFQGRLVPQDPTDEPASVLLERIRQTKAAQSSEPRVRKERAKPAPFEPPEGAPAYSPGREPRVESTPLIPKPPEGATAQGSRSVVPEGTGNLLSPRRGSGNHDDPQTRGSRPGLQAGAPSGGSKLASRLRPPVRAEEEPVAEPEPQEADFLELPRDEQVDIAWEALLGQGTLEKDVAIRTVADELRGLDLARFKRLRQDGPLYGAIAAAIEKGVREGSFDRRRRGSVRAVLHDPKEYTSEDWQRCLLAVTADEPAEIEDTLRAAAEWAREAMGLEYARLREDGVILTGLREALEDEVRAGRIVRRGGTIRRATD